VPQSAQSLAISLMVFSAIARYYSRNAPGAWRRR
jgi:hypothetical protein